MLIRQSAILIFVCGVSSLATNAPAQEVSMGLDPILPIFEKYCIAPGHDSEAIRKSILDDARWKSADISNINLHFFEHITENPPPFSWFGAPDDVHAWSGGPTGSLLITLATQQKGKVKIGICVVTAPSIYESQNFKMPFRDFAQSLSMVFTNYLPDKHHFRYYRFESKKLSEGIDLFYYPWLVKKDKPMHISYKFVLQ